MRYVEDRLIGVPWSRAMSTLIVLLSAATVLLWLDLARNASRYLEPPSAAPVESVLVEFGDATTLALPRGAIRFPSAPLIEAARGAPVATGRVDMHIVAAIGGNTRSIDIAITENTDIAAAGRLLKELYAPYFAGPEEAGPGGLTGRRMDAASPFAGDTVYYLAGETGEAVPYILRCAENAGPLMPETCYRMIRISGGLLLEYRFAGDGLPAWRAIEDRILDLLAEARGGR